MKRHPATGHGLAAAALLVVCLILCTPCAFAQNLKEIHPSGYVTDLAGVVDSDSKARLEALCTEVEQKTGAQIAVVTVKSLEGRSVEDYGVDLYKQLGIGQRSDSRGVLLLVAPDEHKYRIEVGYGLEPVINDARAGDAGRAMVPFLRESNYSAAVEAATWMLAKFIADDRGVTLSGRQPAPRVQARHNDSPIGFWAILFLIWLVFTILRAGRGVTGRRGGGGWWIGPFLGGMGGGWGGGGFGGSSGGGGFGGFGGGSSGGGGASGSW